ncbi:putative methyltransferase tdiE [Colletotrichum shisoi]|uniref:Putative methyltransferase tdiE n=1 Tax=Colletotrichum shisoi TaxID=2078593 RepID=A0A5Q4C3W1_9PEZI|nr:putative methyltransferase tdiE [Colletotrichum shisoi]
MLPSGCALERYWKLPTDVMVRLGREYIDVTALKTLIENTEFADATLSCCKWPIDTWPGYFRYKELGAWNYENISQASEALAMVPLRRAFSWRLDGFDLFLIDVQKDLRNNNCHVNFPV